MIYGLVFLYKEFFIPSLFVVIHKFSCTEDVAGGVVLAIGFLLPELIHNSIAIFIAYPGDLGLGKYVGSVSFNLLIYLGIAGMYIRPDVYKNRNNKLILLSASKE